MSTALEAARGHVDAARVELDSATAAETGAIDAHLAALADVERGFADAKDAIKAHNAGLLAGNAVRLARRRREDAARALETVEANARVAEADELRDATNATYAREQLARLAAEDVVRCARHATELAASRERMRAVVANQAAAVSRSRELGAVDVPAALATTAIGVHLLAAEYAAAVERGERVDLLQHVRAADLASFEHAIRDQEMSLEERREAILDGSLRARVHELQATRAAQQAAGDSLRERKDRIRVIGGMEGRRAREAAATWGLSRDPDVVALLAEKSPKRAPAADVSPVAPSEIAG